MTDSKIVNVPTEFRFQDSYYYPIDNDPDFEYWLSTQIKDEDIKGERIYLPITFTAFYKFNQYGENLDAIKRLQHFIDELDKSKKYFCINQWDNGILNDVSGLDIKVFSMAGKPMDYPLPLIAQPHKFKFENKERKFTACFLGANTHPIRNEIYKLHDVPGFLCQERKYPLEEYCRLLSDSVFSLSPRGFSSASFRCQESLQYQSIPVYVSDTFIEGHYIPFETYGIKINSEDVSKIPDILNSYSNLEIETLRMKGQETYFNFFTFEANKDLILNNILK